MKYYFVMYEDKETNFRDYVGMVECMWTRHEHILNLFFDEYPYVADHSKVMVFDDCKSDKEFFDLARYESGMDVNEYSELYMIVSDHDPSVYHISTNRIDEYNAECSITDQQCQAFRYGLVKSALNLTKLSQFCKDDKFRDYLKMSIFKYVMQFILLDEGVMMDYTVEDNSKSAKLLKFMGMDPKDPGFCWEGIFNMVDMVMYTKIMDGGEL